MQIDHQPGCDMRHRRGERCSAMPSLVAATLQPPIGAPTTMPPSLSPGFVRGGYVIASVGCAATLGVMLVLIATVLIVAWNLVIRDPGFVRDVEPNAAHRVYVNRCCGGSMDGTEPLEIFYGSTQPFEQIVLHYRSEMEKRGFLMYPPQLRVQNDSYLSYEFKKKGWQHCFWIEPYTETYRLGWVNKDDLAGLNAYPFAYVATYLDADVCDG